MRAFKRTVFVASPLALWVSRLYERLWLGWVAELASKRFLRERIRLTQKAMGDAKKETESTARSITATLSADEASKILEKIRVNTQRIFNTTKGLNFALTPSNIPATETVTKTLDSEQADTVRRTINGILQQGKPPKPNITRDMQEALKNLKQDDTITILSAEKAALV